MTSEEQLGFVTCPSGTLLVIDTGYLGLWSHDRPPRLSEGELDSNEATERANTFIDLRIVGTDAEPAGKMLGMSWHPLFVYDQPPHHPELDEKLAKVVREHRLDARFEVLRPRIPHRERVSQAVLRGAGAGEVVFHGVWASAISGVPTSFPLPVRARRVPGQLEWATVLVECQPATRIFCSEKVGSVGVDYARILIADVDSLGVWQHQQSLDGLADFVFWGRDARQVADKLQAPALGDEQFGWSNVTESIAQERAAAVEDFRLNRDLKFASDYRPHSHHWRVMNLTRQSPTQSGVTEVGGATVCNFMTSWGDGIFDVFRDLDESSQLVRVRIELAADPT